MSSDYAKKIVLTFGVKMFGILLCWFVFVVCEDAEELKKIQRRGVYLSKQMDDDEKVVYPNDFSIARQPGPGNQFHPHHYHDHTHGPLNFNHYHHHHDHDVHENSYDDNLNNLTLGIPLDFARNLNDYNVSDLLLNYVDGPDEIREPIGASISSRFGESDTFETERNSAQIARHAKCMPELTTVKIAHSEDANVFYIPECTRIDRCGGCCAHVLLSCQPIETETVTMQVMKTEYTGAKKLKYVGKELVLVEKHTKCKCNCKVRPEDCNSYQEYHESECRCACKNIDEEKKCYKKNSKKLWNPEVCACQCREVMPCSTGYTFDYNECRCLQSQVKRRYILPDTRKETPEPAPLENTE